MGASGLAWIRVEKHDGQDYNPSRPSVASILDDPRIKTVEDVSALSVDGIFDSDEELADFLRSYRDWRRGDTL